MKKGTGICMFNWIFYQTSLSTLSTWSMKMMILHNPSEVNLILILFNMKVFLLLNPSQYRIINERLHTSLHKKNPLDLMIIVLFDFSWMKLNVISHNSAPFVFRCRLLWQSKFKFLFSFTCFESNFIILLISLLYQRHTSVCISFEI